MTQPVALVTHALVFAGPPAVRALLDAGFRVAVRDTAFASSGARESHRATFPEVLVLPDQEPAPVVQAAWRLGERLDVLVSNDACTPIERAVPAGRLARPEEISELILYLATMEGRFLTGAVIDFSGGWPVGIPPPRAP